MPLIDFMMSEIKMTRVTRLTFRCAAFFGIFLSATLVAEAAQRPNIVLILSDDQAWTDYGFMQHPVIETPNLDRLAKGSLVFDRGYVASPLCRPSLASMITGLQPFQHGITGNDVQPGAERATLDIPLRHAFHQHPSFIRALTESGYVAHQSGKFWEGSFQDGGFTHGMTHGDPQRGGRHGDAGLKIGRQGLLPVTTFIDEAIEDEKPFFVWYAPFLPHTPHNPPQRLVAKYKQPGRAADVTKYFAMCDWFDETCGELLGHIDDQGVANNTMVIYICDNGWAAKSTNLTDPDQKNWNGFALRSKGSPFENGIRTPIMVSWPGHMKPERANELAHSIDLFPTIVKAAGLQAPDHLQGIDLLNAEARRSRNHVFGVTHSIHNMTVGAPNETVQYLWCVEADWKLIQRFSGSDTTKYKAVHAWDTTPMRLYNLKSDPHETNNLAATHPAIVARLKKAISDWHAPTAATQSH
ncbi:MAG: sulfatase-like hydrolase/transferase [Fuerstiella sp.]